MISVTQKAISALEKYFRERSLQPIRVYLKAG